MRVFVDVTDTLGSSLRTGVQRVAVEAARALAPRPRVTLVHFDRAAGEYRRLTPAETARLLQSEHAAQGAASGRRRRLLHALGLYRPMAFALDLSRRSILHPLRRMTHPWGPTETFLRHGPVVFYTAEIVGDRARVRKLEALSRRPGFHLVFTVHDLIPWTHPELSLLHGGDYQRYLKLLGRSRLLCPVSEATLDDLRAWQKRSRPRGSPKLIRLYPGVEAPRAGAQGPSLREVPRLAAVGTIEARKNQHRLLDVLEGLWSEGAEFQFVFAGGRSRTSAPFEVRYHELVAKGRSLRWLNPATEAELEDLYARSAATVYVSGLEGFGLPVVESVARGTPCIASSRGAVGEVARHYGGCLLVDPDRPETWAKAFREILDHPSHRARILATLRTDRLATWQDYADDLLKAASEVVEGAQA